MELETMEKSTNYAIYKVQNLEKNMVYSRDYKTTEN